jgi:hypothetical protein
MEDLKNSFTQGSDKYLKAMGEAYNLLVNWKQNPQNYMRVVDNTHDGAMFVTTITDAGGDSGFHGKCWICKQSGHRKSKCPMQNDKMDPTPPPPTMDDKQEDKKPKTKGTQLLMDAIEEVSLSCEFMFQQQSCDEIKTLHNWILLDNQSTVNVFCNSNLIQNIRQAPSTLQLKCNAGIVYIDRIADLPGYPEPVWFHDKGIANVLSLSRVSKFFPVTYDNGEGFIIHMPDCQKHKFRESPRGLFYLDPSQQSKSKGDALLVMTVKKKKTAYSERDVRRAELARKLQHILGHPSTKQLVKIIKANQLPNCPIGREDVIAAEDIFGKKRRWFERQDNTQETKHCDGGLHKLATWNN